MSVRAETLSLPRATTRITGVHEKDLVGILELRDGTLITFSMDCTIKRWSRRTERFIVEYVGHHDWVAGVFECVGEVDDNGVLGKRRLLSGSYDYYLKLWDLDTGECLQTSSRLVDFCSSIVKLSHHHHDGLFVCGYDSGSIEVRRLADIDYVVQQIQFGHETNVWSLCELGDGSILSSCLDRKIKRWKISDSSLEDIKCLQTFKVDSEAVILPLSNGLLFATCSRDYSVQLWDAEGDSNCIESFTGHTLSAVSIAELSSNDNAPMIVSVSKDTTLRLWRTGLGCLATYQSNDDVSFQAVIWLKDGSIAVGHADELAVYDLLTYISILFTLSSIV